MNRKGTGCTPLCIAGQKREARGRAGGKLERPPAGCHSEGREFNDLVQMALQAARAAQQLTQLANQGLRD